MGDLFRFVTFRSVTPQFTQTLSAFAVYHKC